MSAEFVEAHFKFPTYFECPITPKQLSTLADMPMEGKSSKARELVRYSGVELDENATSPLGLVRQELLNGVPASPGASEFHLDSSNRGEYQLFYADVWPTEFASCTVYYAKRFQTLSLFPTHQSAVFRRIENAVLRRTAFRSHWLQTVHEQPKKFEKFLRIEDLSIESRAGAVAIGKIDETLHRSPIVTTTTGGYRFFTTAFAQEYRHTDANALK
jgi:hypothetical protein